MSTVTKTAVKKKKRRRLKPGLWFGPRKIEVEKVKKAHKTVCCMCRKRPETIRLKVVDGSGKHQTTRMFCAQHGVRFLAAMEQECQRAVKYIVDRSFEVISTDARRVPRMGNIESIRPNAYGTGDLGMDYLKEKARERAERKAKKS